MLNKHRSLLKALSFLCILSLVLSLVPPVGIWQSTKADDTNVYNGGYDSYNGKSYGDWARDAGVDPEHPKMPNLHLNAEIYAERRQVVYGTPDDVPENRLVSPPGFKPDPDGYFYAVPHTDSQGRRYYTLALPGTPGAVRGWFRFLGYTKEGVEHSDPYFPPDGNGKEAVKYSNIIAQP